MVAGDVLKFLKIDQANAVFEQFDMRMSVYEMFVETQIRQRIINLIIIWQ